MTILLIDDEASVRKFVRHALEGQNLQVHEASSGEEGLQMAMAIRPDLIVLDYGLPRMSGLEVLKSLREWSQVPVLFLSVRESEEDKVEVLDAGADDFLTKPFSVPELLARIRVALRRHVRGGDEGPVFQQGPLEVDRARHLVKLDGKNVKLTSTEFALLVLLTRQRGKVLPHRQILKEIWGPNSVEHVHYLRVYFGQIRKKLEAVRAGAGELIENVAGVGYRLRQEPTAP